MNWAALLTSPGRGAVATIAIDAPADGGVTVQLPWRGATRTSLADIPLHAIALGQWGGDVAEEVVIGRVGESKWEIHCHGGVAASARILDDLRQAGFNLLTGFEWIALHDGLLVAEWSDALSRAETARTAQLLHEQSDRSLATGRRSGCCHRRTIAARMSPSSNPSCAGLALAAI